MRLHAIVWLGSLVLLLWTIQFQAVQRTQEARVLVTAREMLERSNAGEGWRAWTIPHANGEVRLQKPPLAYWMAAASFKLFGVHDWSGRLPFVLCGWLTVLLTYHIALHKTGGATWAAALLIGSFLFHYHSRMAETDIVLTLALSIAIYAIWQGFDLSGRQQTLWFQLSGVAIGFAAMAKGLPALYAVLFLVAMTLVTRRWRVALRWVSSGAPIFAAAIGLPWWIYIRNLPNGEIVTRELTVLLEEPNHPGWFFMYFPNGLKATLPWSPILVVALIDAAINWRRDSRIADRLTPVVLWCAVILLPLFFLGNKQAHYLLPMMPPLALIAAWWLDRAAKPDVSPAAQSTVRLIVIGTGIVLMVAALGLPMLARQLRGDIVSIDLIFASGLMLAAIIVIRQMRRDYVAGITTYCVVGAICLSVALGYWRPTSEPQTPRTVAAEIRELGNGPYCFYGENFSLPLVHGLRTIVPQANDARELTQLMSAHRGLLIIAQTKADRPPPPEPIGCETIREILMKDQKFEIYRSIQ